MILGGTVTGEFKTPEEWERYRQECLEELCDMMKIWFFHLWD